MPKSKEYASWNIPVPFVLDQAVEDAVKSGQFISKSDFVRCACRKELASTSKLNLSNRETVAGFRLLGIEPSDILKSELKPGTK